MKRAAKKILDSNSILVVSHKRPDGDSIGSQIGLVLGLKKLKKKVDCLNEDPVPEMFSFLKGRELIKTSFKTQKKTDLIVCLDISNAERAGDNLSSLINGSGTFTINIDHHVSNEMFGDFNIVDKDASSTSELVFKLLKALRVDPDRQIADALLTGIVTDTGSFRYSNVSGITLKTAADLLDLGGDISNISTNVYMSKPLSKVRLASKMLERIEIIKDKAFSYLLKDDFIKLGAKMEYTDGLVNEILNIDGINFAVLLTEESDSFSRMSFRSKSDKYDANLFAGRFNGGGHKFAAGGRLNEAGISSIKKLKRELKGL